MKPDPHSATRWAVPSTAAQVAIGEVPPQVRGGSKSVSFVKLGVIYLERFWDSEGAGRLVSHAEGDAVLV
jgi:hypothetical protein